MERAGLLGQLAGQVAQLARRRALGDASAASYPLPATLSVHLWLYACGLAGPTVPPPGSR